MLNAVAARGRLDESDGVLNRLDGVVLEPGRMGPGRLSAETPFANLFLANATAGYPSVAGTVKAGLDLHRRMR